MKNHIAFDRLNDVSRQAVKALKYKIDLLSESEKIIAIAGLKCRTDLVVSYLADLNSAPKTVFVDTDCYNGRLAANLGKSGFGIGDFVNGKKNLAEIIQKINENTDFIAAGADKIAPDAQKFNEVMTYLAENYDKIVLNCPPYAYEADCIRALRYSDAAFLGIQVGMSKKKVSECLNSLEVAGVKLKGCFLSEA